MESAAAAGRVFRPAAAVHQEHDMPFIPRLPTWHNDVTVVKYDSATDTYEELETPITGQIYTQLRNQDDDTGGTLYFEYPKEDDLLRDLADYNFTGKADILLVSFPTSAPRVLPYLVRDVQPRWLDFPNEHLMATLRRLSPQQYEDLISVDPPPPGPGVYSATMFWEDWSADTDGDFALWSELSGTAGTLEATFDGTNSPTNTAFWHNPGYSIPSTATIVGLRVRQGRTANIVGSPVTGNHVYDLTAAFVYPGPSISDNLASLIAYPYSGGSADYGDDSEMWSIPLTYTLLNTPASMSFVKQSQTTNPTLGILVQLSAPQVTVYYTLP